MKYPKKFTLVDREDCFIVEATYDDIKKAYMLDHGNGTLTTFEESDIDRIIQDYYDIVEEIVEDSPEPLPGQDYEYPDSLSFTHDTTSQLYDLVKIPNLNKWACYQDGSTHGATYTAEEIAGHFEKGHWKELSFAEAQDAEPVERDLVFPFTFVVDSDAFRYTAVSQVDEEVKVNWLGDKEGVTYPVSKVKKFIKNGIWIVKDVGPQKAPEPSYELPKPTRPAPPMPECKPSAKVLDKLTVEIDSDSFLVATERARTLAQAVEDLNISLESLQSIFAETREIVFGMQPQGCVTFCCEEV